MAKGKVGPMCRMAGPQPSPPSNLKATLPPLNHHPTNATAAVLRRPARLCPEHRVRCHLHRGLGSATISPWSTQGPPVRTAACDRETPPWRAQLPHCRSPGPATPCQYRVGLVRNFSTCSAHYSLKRGWDHCFVRQTLGLPERWRRNEENSGLFIIYTKNAS